MIAQLLEPGTVLTSIGLALTGWLCVTVIKMKTDIAIIRLRLKSMDNVPCLRTNRCTETNDEE